MNKKEFIMMFLIFNLKLKDLATYNFFKYLQEKRKNGEEPIYQPFILRENQIYCEEIELFFEKLLFLKMIDENEEPTRKGILEYMNQIKIHEEEFKKLKKMKLITKYKEIKKKSCYVPNYDFINCGVCQEKVCENNFFENIKAFLKKENTKKNPYKSL